MNHNWKRNIKRVDVYYLAVLTVSYITVDTCDCSL